jgi:1-acyl-sn-glycerol-3-phosphate acyltransferase
VTEGSSSFLKKRTKKLLRTRLGGPPQAERAQATVKKVFWFFFSKKNTFLPYAQQQNPIADISPNLLAAFRLYLRWYFWRSFSGVRLSRATQPPSAPGRPIVVYTNHPSWWDPALFILVTETLFPGRAAFGPMDGAQLARYGIFRRMGVFGIDPTPRGAAAFLHVARATLANPKTIMWVTAEGKFTDTRQRPIILRRGIAHLARQMPEAIFLPIAVEYSFWNESRPEALLRIGTPVMPPDSATVDSWQTSLESALERTADALAAESMARDPARFTSLLRGTAGAGGIYDLYRRARAAISGKTFDPRHEPEQT